MTMRTCGRVVPFGVADGSAGIIMFMEGSTQYFLQITRNTQALEGVFGLVVERAPRALRHLGVLKLDQDFFNARGSRIDRKRDVGIAERAITLAAFGEIKRNDRDVFALRIGPYVGFGPMQDRVNTQMRTRRRGGVELVPEFWRLVANVPSALSAARREHPLLGARGLFVAANAGDQSVEAVFGERTFEAFGLAGGRARRRGQGRIDGVDRWAGLDLQIEAPFLAEGVAKRIHLRKFLAGIDMQGRKRHAAKERLAREPDHDVGIFAERPQQRQLLEPREGFTENVDALRLEGVEVVHRGR